MILLLHYHAVLVVFRLLWWVLPHLGVSRRCHVHGRPAADSSTNSRQSLLRTLVARVGCLDVPYIGLQNIATASDTHLGKVTDGVLCLDEACYSISC